MIIDFIPFGDISSENDTVSWPEKDVKEMNRFKKRCFFDLPTLYVVV